MKAEEIANQIIKELEDAGFTPDQMLEVIKLAKEKYQWMKSNTTKNTPVRS